MSREKFLKASATVGAAVVMGVVSILGYDSLYTESFNPHLIGELTEGERYYRIYGACTRFDTPMVDPRNRRFFGQIIDQERRTILADTNGPEKNIQITPPKMNDNSKRREFGGFTYTAKFGQVEITGTLTCPAPLPNSIRSLIAF